MRASLVKVAIAASAALVLASCAMPADDPNYDPNGTGGGATAAAVDTAVMDSALAAPTSIGVDTPLTAAPAKDLSIISLTDGSEYSGVFDTALSEAGATLGWTVESVTVDPADPMAVATAFDDALAKKPAGIRITGAFADSLFDSLPKAASANIPVVCTGCAGEPANGITDSSIDGTAQNTEWGNSLSTYVATSQYEGEDAGVQIFVTPGGGVNDFNVAFDTNLLALCHNCSTSQSVVDPTMVDTTDPAAIATFVDSEMSTSLGAWALLDSGALAPGVADTLANDPTLLSPVVLIGRGASASDIEALKALGGAAPAADATAAATEAAATAAATEAAATEGATDAAAAATAGRTPEQTAALQAWIAIPQPVMAWRVIDQFARIIGGDALATGPLPSQLLTGANAADAVVDEAGNYIGVADYQTQFKTLWGVK